MIRIVLLWLVAVSVSGAEEVGEAKRKEAEFREKYTRVRSEWDGFEPGSWCEHEYVSEDASGKHVTGSRRTLLARKPEGLEIESRTWTVEKKEDGSAVRVNEQVSKDIQPPYPPGQVRSVTWLRAETLKIGDRSYACDVFNVVEPAGHAPEAKAGKDIVSTLTVWASAEEPGNAYVLKLEGKQPEHPMGAAEFDTAIIETAKELTVAGKKVTCTVLKFSQTYGGESTIHGGETVSSEDVPGRMVSIRSTHTYAGGGGRKVFGTSGSLTDFHAVRKEGK
ncbi:MAG: hypothetical protein K8T20_14810 [Planctomycetes bacterium]|nr:hypothetical protein [Planctomycetota bacterium]